MRCWPDDLAWALAGTSSGQAQGAAVVEFAERHGVELINVGTWDVSTGRWKCGPDDLAAAVAAQSCTAIRRPYLKLGHVDPRFDGEPAIGWVQNLRVTNGGQTLVGDFTNMPAWLNSVMATAYPDRSVEARYNVQCSLGHTHPFVLDGLALLGVTAPGVTTLRSLRDVPALFGVAASADQPASNSLTFIVRASRATPAATPAATPRSSSVPKPRIYDRPRVAGEPTVDWAISTGRIKASDASYWQGLGDIADRVLVRLAAGTATPLTSAGAPATTVHVTASTPAARKRPGVDPAWYALNPALDSLRAANAEFVQAAAQNDPNPPTLFRSGDLPPFTASGIDPSLLLDVPWTVRHRLAEIKDRAEALELLQWASSEDGPDAGIEYYRDMANRDYESRVLRWASENAQVVDRARAEHEQAIAASATSAASAAAVPVDQMTSDEVYDAAFGEYDRRRGKATARRGAAAATGRAWLTFDQSGGSAR